MVEKVLSLVGVFVSALTESKDSAILIPQGAAFQAEETTKAMAMNGLRLEYMKNYMETV